MFRLSAPLAAQAVEKAKEKAAAVQRKAAEKRAATEAKLAEQKVSPQYDVRQTEPATLYRQER